MNIGIPKERRPFEYRVGLSPAGVEILSQMGNHVWVEHEAGVGAGFSDREYEKAGARLVYSGEEVYGRADLLLKVARPLKEELDWLLPGGAVAGMLHLASARQDKLDVLLEKQVTSIAYEQIALADGSSYGIGAPAGKVALLFPGQGSQYLEMGAALAMISAWSQMNFHVISPPWEKPVKCTRFLSTAKASMACCMKSNTMS